MLALLHVLSIAGFAGSAEAKEAFLYGGEPIHPGCAVVIGNPIPGGFQHVVPMHQAIERIELELRLSLRLRHGTVHPRNLERCASLLEACAQAISPKNAAALSGPPVYDSYNGIKGLEND